MSADGFARYSRYIISGSQSKLRYLTGLEHLAPSEHIIMAARTIVLVTGANSGLGYETVRAFLTAEKAYHVFLASRNKDNANQAVETLSKECPNVTNTVEPLHLELTSDESIDKAFEHVKSTSGHLDALINNAGALLWCKA